MTKEQLIKNYNYNEGIIKYKNDLIFLTNTENKAFKILLNNYNRIVNVDKICKLVYKDEYDPTYAMAIRTVISRLRKKIKPIAIIQCKTYFGYRLILK